MNRKVINFLLFVFILFYYIPVSSQVFQEWVSIYNGTLINSNDGASAICTDNAGFVYVGGSAFHTGTSRDMLTIKLTSTGDTVWVRKYNGSNNAGDYAFDITVDNSGNVYVTGRCDNGLPTYSDYTTIKYNSAGVQQWAAFYNGTANGVDESNCVKVDNSGNVYVSGKSPGTGTNLDIVTVKYNSAGVQQWVQRINGTANNIDNPFSMALTSTGDIVIAGTLYNTGKGSDFAVIKYNSAGVQQWLNLYNNPAVNGGDIARSVVIDASDNIIAAGFADNGYVGTQPKHDYVTIKYNSSGVQQWVAVYNGSGNMEDYAYDAAVDASGNAYITGKSEGAGTNYDYATIKYSSAGIQLWVQRFNGTGNSYDEAVSIAVDASGNAYIGGGSETLGNDTNYALIKYNTNGVMQWFTTYQGSGNGNDMIRAIALSGSNYIYVTGESFGIGTGCNIATIKYFGCNFFVNAGNDTTIIIGYGTQTAALNAVTTGGMSPYHYTWSTGDTTQSITVSPIHTTAYFVNVTDYKNCTAVDTVVVNVLNIGCSPHKVYICHKGETICVDINSVQAHLNHGDELGQCNNNSDIQKEITLNGNYPNPFNPVTTISFDLPFTAHAKLIIYDYLGREVSVLNDSYFEPGRYSFNWDANNFASGIYFCTLKVNGFEQTRKMVLLK